ncbi:MAG: glycosyltransferase family 8 protein [Rikenellaceae bacterium]|nr:glycosyltransferase family 8 protein [Rikenellaceae bacterium]MDE7133769.1 glycosyltransferase family 8 protein [Rikenellaceae bacterium]MDE7355492.1 glycosyltransferase family 8 protein [Rikenellaceae bacterium]
MIPIVFSTDHNYVMQTGVCILSLLESAQETLYDIYVIISRDVTDDDKMLLQSQVAKINGHKISFIPAPTDFDSAFEIRGISTAAYYRLLIPWLLADFDKVIYSDIDVIFRTSLQEVFTTDLADNYFGAVPGVSYRYPSEHVKKHLKKISVSNLEYVNSGFLIVNSALLRKDNLKEAFISEAGKKHQFQDQDVINIVCKGRIMHISPKYCITQTFQQSYLNNAPFMHEFYGCQSAIDDYLHSRNCIIHYAGPKPWEIVSFAWLDWWDTYHRSVFYNPDYELAFLNRVRNPKYKWRDILRIIKNKLLH